MKVKVCGLTQPIEATYLNENKVDMAGMVLFCEKSKRNITPDQAKEILKALNPDIKTVAVVVSPSVEEIQIIEKLGFDYVQIHGIMTAKVLEMVAIPVLKAFNVLDMESYETYHNCPKVTGYVFDAQQPGSGKTFDWKLVEHVPRDEKLLLLAGGLHPDNVAQAIAAVHPDGVDVSTGVEFTERPGKDPEKIKQFVKMAK